MFSAGRKFSLRVNFDCCGIRRDGFGRIKLNMVVDRQIPPSLHQPSTHGIRHFPQHQHWLRAKLRIRLLFRLCDAQGEYFCRVSLAERMGKLLTAVVVGEHSLCVHTRHSVSRCCRTRYFLHHLCSRFRCHQRSISLFNKERRNMRKFSWNTVE